MKAYYIKDLNSGKIFAPISISSAHLWMVISFKKSKNRDYPTEKLLKMSSSELFSGELKLYRKKELAESYIKSFNKPIRYHNRYKDKKGKEHEEIFYYNNPSPYNLKVIKINL